MPRCRLPCAVRRPACVISTCGIITREINLNVIAESIAMQ